MPGEPPFNGQVLGQDTVSVQVVPMPAQLPSNVHAEMLGNGEPRVYMAPPPPYSPGAELPMNSQSTTVGAQAP